MKLILRPFIDSVVIDLQLLLLKIHNNEKYILLLLWFQNNACFLSICHEISNSGTNKFRRSIVFFNEGQSND